MRPAWYSEMKSWDHVVAETLREVPHVERDAEHVSGTTGVQRILDGAAPTTARAQGSSGPGECQMHSDHVVPRLHGSGGRDGGVDSTAHRRKDPHCDPVYERAAVPAPDARV